ncbi:TetR family transcriptional regulator C-terminal domain-containing protein [Nocardia grenadensis]|uniref:TetR family transcriptional regulator C-terminal domain-containing protein n=1 Tax=Nocardia grenadensis TaxID=931537 RepID=UPI003D929D2C
MPPGSTASGSNSPTHSPGAAAQGDLAAGADPHQEAARLVALANGLGTSVLAGQQNIQTATELVRYHLDQLFPAG